MDIKEIIIKVFGEDFNINEIGNKGHFAALFEEIRTIPNNTDKQFSFMDELDNISAKEEAKLIDAEVESIATIFIEPNIELYSKLLWLMNSNTKNLELRGLLNKELITKSNEFIDVLEFVISCSKKEIDNESFSEEEKEALNKLLLRGFEEFNEIYIIVPYEEKLYLTKGIVSSLFTENMYSLK